VGDGTGLGEIAWFWLLSGGLPPRKAKNSSVPAPTTMTIKAPINFMFIFVGY
jgi:hypothetical protein